MLRLHSGAGVAVAVATLVLAVASASSPLFVSSAASAAFGRVLGTSASRFGGLWMAAAGQADEAAWATLDDRLRREAAALDGLAAPVGSLAGTRFQGIGAVVGLRASVDGERVVAAGEVAPAVLFSREGAFDAIEAVEPPVGVGGDGSVSGRGLWVPNGTAAQLGLSPGDVAELVVASVDGEVYASTPAPILGVYRDPFERGGADDGLLPREDPDSYWANALLGIPRVPGSLRAPPLLLADRPAFLSYAAAIDERVYGTWEAPLEDPETALPVARRLATGLEALAEAAAAPDAPLGKAVRNAASVQSLRVETTLPDAVEQADELAAALVPPVRALSLAAQAVGLGLVGVAAAFLTRRRRGELRLLAAQGVGPARIAMRAPFETLPAVLVGAAVGWAVSAPLVRLTGPSPALDPAGVAQARVFVSLAALTALIVVGVAVGLAARTAHRLSTGRAEDVAHRIAWEPVVLALAAAAGYQALLRGSGAVRSADGDAGVGGVDVLVMAFPLLAVAGVVGLVVRGLARVLPRLTLSGAAAPAGRGLVSGADGGRTGVGRRSGSQARVAAGSPRGLGLAPWLVARRLARAPSHALALVTVAAVAMGLFVYAATLAGSAGPAVDAKVVALAGAEASSELSHATQIDPDGGVPDGLPPGITVVWRGDAQALPMPDGPMLDVLAVDPSTFAQAALWHDALADRPLAELLAMLAPDDHEDRNGQGDAGEGAQVGVQRRSVPVLAVGGWRVNAWRDRAGRGHRVRRRLGGCDLRGRRAPTGVSRRRSPARCRGRG